MLATLLKDRDRQRERERGRDAHTVGREQPQPCSQADSPPFSQSERQICDQSFWVHPCHQDGASVDTEGRQPGSSETAEAEPGNSKHSRTALKPTLSGRLLAGLRHGGGQTAGRRGRHLISGTQPDQILLEILELGRQTAALQSMQARSAPNFRQAGKQGQHSPISP